MAGEFTATELANFIPEEWSNEIIADHEPNRAMDALVMQMKHGKGRGQVVHVPAPGRLDDATTLTEGNAVTWENDTAGVLDITINRHVPKGIVIHDWSDQFILPSARKFYVKELSRSIYNELDKYLHSLGAAFGGGSTTAGSAYSKAVSAADGSTVWDGSANTNTGNGGVITDAGVRTAIQALEDANVMGEINLVGPPSVKAALYGIDRYVSSDFVGEGKVAKGEAGSLAMYGVRLVSSTNCATLTADDTSTDYRVSLMFEEEAIVHAEAKSMTVKSMYDIDYLRVKIVAHHMYGARVYRPENGIALVSPV